MATESTPPDEVPDVQGLDTALGLEHVAGNRKLYLKLLRRYIDGQSGAAQALRACLSSGDRKTAERIAHTAKGVSGSIGAGAVQHAAEPLETAISTGNETEAMIAAFECALDAMIKQLQNALRSLPAAVLTPAPPVDASKLEPVLRRLAALLAASDGEVLDVFSAAEPQLRLALGAEFTALEKSINSLELEAALETLKSAAGRYNIAL